MREFYETISEALATGLYRSKELRPSKPGLSICINARPCEDGLREVVKPRDLTQDALGDITLWPFPAVFQYAGGSMILCTRTGIYTLEADVAGTLTALLTSGIAANYWTMADFHGYFVLTDGTGAVYDAVIGTNPPFPYYTVAANSNMPALYAVCNFNGMLVGVGKSGNTGDGDRNWVWYSHIGGAARDALFTMGEGSDAGNFQLNTPGHGLQVKKLSFGGRDAVIVYGERSITQLVPNDGNPVFAFGQRQLASFGIAGVYAVAGDDNMHIFVSSAGDVWRLNAQGLEKLGYSRHIHPMIAMHEPAIEGQHARVVVTHNPFDDEFYICDDEVGYVLTKTGLGQTPYLVAPTYGYGNVGGTRRHTTDTWSHGGHDYNYNIYNQFTPQGFRAPYMVALYGATDCNVVIASGRLNMRTQSIKTISALDAEFSIRTKELSSTVRRPSGFVDYRYNAYQQFADEGLMQWQPMRRVSNIQFFDGTSAMVTVAGREFRIGFEFPWCYTALGQVYLPVEFHLSQLGCRFKYTDKQHIRGAYANPQSAAFANQ